MKKHIPNLITLGNLLCGTMAVFFTIKGDFYVTAILILLGILFDFFDGFVARLLNVQAELGKQLDSLADMVTSGVVPGIVMVKLLEIVVDEKKVMDFGATGSYLPYFGLLLTLGAGYRLAKFNIDTRQTDDFIGLPTPSMSLFIISLPLIITFAPESLMSDLIFNQWILIIITILFTFLMNAELPLFSLKFKDYSIKNNVVKYLFLLTSLVLIIFLKLVAMPIIILLYVMFSIIYNFEKKLKKEKEV